MSNEEIFPKYYIQLHNSVHNEHNYQSYVYLLGKFKAFVADRKPTPNLAKEFVADYHTCARNTQVKYATIIKGFMKFYGEPVEDLNIKQPRSSPQVVEEEDIEKLFNIRPIPIRIH